MFNVGDLVMITDHEDNALTGIILEIHYWVDGVDLYIHWSNEETYWCIGDAVKLI